MNILCRVPRDHSCSRVHRGSGGGDEIYFAFGFADSEEDQSGIKSRCIYCGRLLTTRNDVSCHTCGDYIAKASRLVLEPKEEGRYERYLSEERNKHLSDLNSGEALILADPYYAVEQLREKLFRPLKKSKRRRPK